MSGSRPAAKLLFTLLLAAFATALHAQAKLSIQGFLKKSDGTALADGEYSLRFRIYNAETGGTALWTETQPAVDVTGGIYSAVLGSVEPLNISFTEPYFVSVAVGSATEMVPRIPLTSAPYALSLIGQDNKFPSSGNVGVGVVSPTEKLHVKNTTNASSTAKILLEGPSAGFTELNVKKAGLAGLGYLGYTPSSSAFRLGHTSGNLDLITSSPNSVIYLSTPTTGQVQVASSLLVERNVVARGGAPGASGSNQNGYAFAGSGGDNDSGLYSTGDGHVSLYANNTETVDVEPNRVNVSGGVYARGGQPGGFGVNRNGYSFDGTVGDDDSGMYSLGTNSVSLFADAVEKVRLTSGDVYMYNLQSGGAGLNVAVTSGGQLFRVGSSARYKQNIQPLVTDFKRVLDIEPKSYNYKTTPEKLDIGFIAEELDSLGLKHLVVYDQEGRPDGVLYDRAVVYLIPLLREQQQRIAALEAAQAENAALRQSLQSLRADVEALKAGAAQVREGERK